MQSKKSKAKVTPVRQRTQYTCMATSLSMCLKALGYDLSEDEVNRVMGARPMKGARWEEAFAAAQHFGARATLVTPCTVQALKEWTDKEIPVMISWNPEKRDWSHASVVFDVVDEDGTFMVYVADPNIPNPTETVRVLSEDEFYGCWSEAWDSYLVRRVAMAVEREITPEGRQVQASAGRWKRLSKGGQKFITDEIMCWVTPEDTWDTVRDRDIPDLYEVADPELLADGIPELVKMYQNAENDHAKWVRQGWWPKPVKVQKWKIYIMTRRPAVKNFESGYFKSEREALKMAEQAIPIIEASKRPRWMKPASTTAGRKGKRPQSVNAPKDPREKLRIKVKPGTQRNEEAKFLAENRGYGNPGAHKNKGKRKEGPMRQRKHKQKWDREGGAEESRLSVYSPEKGDGLTQPLSTRPDYGSEESFMMDVNDMKNALTQTTEKKAKTIDIDSLELWLNNLSRGDLVQAYWTAGSGGHYNAKARVKKVNRKSVIVELLEDVMGYPILGGGGEEIAYPKGHPIKLPTDWMDRRFSVFFNAPMPIGVTSTRKAADIESALPEALDTAEFQARLASTKTARRPAKLDHEWWAKNERSFMNKLKGAERMNLKRDYSKVLGVLYELESLAEKHGWPDKKLEDRVDDLMGKAEDIYEMSEGPIGGSYWASTKTAIREKRIPKGDFAIIISKGMDDFVASVHKTEAQALEALKRKHGIEPGPHNPMGAPKIVDVSRRGPWEIIPYFGKLTVRPKRASTKTADAEKNFKKPHHQVHENEGVEVKDVDEAGVDVDAKEAKFEKGKPADPTENMTEEQKKKWMEHHGQIGNKKASDIERLLTAALEVKKLQGKGLYGYTLGTQRTVEATIRKATRRAAKIAKALYKKDSRTAMFLGTHAKRSKSASARILVACMKDLGPKVAAEMDKTAARFNPDTPKAKAALEKVYKLAAKEYVQALYKHLGSNKKAFQDAWSATSPGKSGKFEDWVAIQFADRASRGWFDAAREVTMEMVGWLNDPSLTNQLKLGSFEAVTKTAGLGMYGMNTKVARLALAACTDVTEMMGQVAYDLHARKANRHERITGFLKNHSKSARCLYAKMLLASYPDATATILTAEEKTADNCDKMKNPAMVQNCKDMAKGKKPGKSKSKSKKKDDGKMPPEVLEKFKAKKSAGDTALDKVYALSDLLKEIGRELPPKSTRSPEMKAVQSALYKLEAFVEKAQSNNKAARSRLTTKLAESGLPANAEGEEPKSGFPGVEESEEAQPDMSQHGYDPGQTKNAMLMQLAKALTKIMAGEDSSSMPGDEEGDAAQPEAKGYEVGEVKEDGYEPGEVNKKAKVRVVELSDGDLIWLED